MAEWPCLVCCDRVTPSASTAVQDAYRRQAVEQRVLAGGLVVVDSGLVDTDDKGENAPRHLGGPEGGQQPRMPTATQQGQAALTDVRAPGRSLGLGVVTLPQVGGYRVDRGVIYSNLPGNPSVRRGTAPMQAH